MSGREHLAGVQREIETCCVGQVKTGKVRLSGQEHLAGVQREIKTCCVGQVKTGKVRCVAGRLSPTSDGRKILAVWMGKSRRPWGGKGKVVWPGGSRRRPTGDQDSHYRKGKDGKVKLGGRETLAVT